MSITAKQYAFFLGSLLSENPNKQKKIIKDFISFLVLKKDQKLLPKILDEISELIDLKNHTLYITITSSLPIENTTQISQLISEKINQPVEINNQIDQTLIGGLILYSSDWKIDFSIKSILNKQITDQDSKLPSNLIFALGVLEKSL